MKKSKSSIFLNVDIATFEKIVYRMVKKFNIKSGSAEVDQPNLGNVVPAPYTSLNHWMLKECG